MTRTNTDDGKTLMGEDASLTDNAAGPIGTTMSKLFGESDEASTVSSGFIQSVNGEDATHVASK